jgi:hypothetical protein
MDFFPYGALAAFISFIGIMIGLAHNENARLEKRIEEFEKNFFSAYKNDGRVLEFLIPAGIVNLKNDDEIAMAIERIGNRLRFNPLRIWDEDIKRIGYKDFFQKVANGPGPLNKDVIGVYIQAWINKEGN